jgi:PAS domain S-box-containing protein
MYVAPVRSETYDGPPTEGPLSNPAVSRIAAAQFTTNIAVLRVLLDSIPEIVVAVNAGGEIEYINRHGEAAFGYSLSDMAGKTIDLLVPERFRHSHISLVRTFVAAAPPAHAMLEGRIVTAMRKDGTEFPVEARLTTASLENGQLIGIAIITDLSGPERMRRERDDFFRLTPDLLATLTSDGRFQQVNPAFERTLGWSSSQLHLRHFIEILYPDDRERTLNILAEVLRSHGTVADLETRCVCHSGSICWCNWSLHAESGGLRIVTGRDITRCKMSSIETQRLSSLVEHSPLFIASISADGQFKVDHLNAAGRKLVDAPSGRPDLQACCGIDDATMHEIRHSIEQKGSWHGETDFRNARSGERIPVEVEFVEILGPSNEGKRLGFSMIARDIRARKRAQEEIQASLNRLQQLVDLAPVEMAMLDLDMRLLAFSNRMRQVYQVSGDVRGQLLQDVFPGILEHMGGVFQRCLAGATESIPGQWFVIPNVGRRLIKWMIRPWHRVTGQVGGLLSFTEDITEFFRANQMLAESEERFRTLVEQASDAFFVHNDLGSLTSVNRLACDMLGYSRQELLRLSFHDLFTAQYAAGLMEIWENPQSGPPQTITGRIRRKDGREIPVEARVGVCTLEGRRSFLALVRDMSGRLRDEARLRALAAQLLTAREEERRHIALELHDDFTQKLAVLGIELDFLRKREGTPTDVSDTLATLRESVVALSEEMRELSHQYHPGTLDHLGLGPAAEAYCQEVARHSGIDVTLQVRNLPEGLPHILALTLYRILQEALRNVVRHSGSTAAHVFLTGSSDPPRITLAVVDHGCGFLIEDVRNGSGLGLLSIEERSRLVQGVMRLSSIPGEGTRLEVEVPLPAVIPQ